MTDIWLALCSLQSTWTNIESLTFCERKQTFSKHLFQARHYVRALYLDAPLIFTTVFQSMHYLHFTGNEIAIQIS